MEVRVKKIPWTEKYRPRFLGELILKRSQKTYLLSWWRCWKVWWILRNRWEEKEKEKWFSWTSNEEGKEWAKEHIDEWREFFKKQFGNWMGDLRDKVEKAGSYYYPPNSQQELFEKITKTQYKLELKPEAEQKIQDWFQNTWEKFIEKENVQKEVHIPPLPPYDPLILIGPPGNGKSSTAIALSGEVGVPLIELNASDDRSKKSVRKKLGRVTQSTTLSTSKSQSKPTRLILFDEVDGMSGRKDRGGFGELLKQLEKTRLPVILTANDKEDRNVRRLMRRYYDTTVFFDRPAPYQIEKLIEMISEREDVEFPDWVSQKLKKSQDLRTVVSALENFHNSGTIPELEKDKMRSFKSSLKKNFAFKQEELEETISYIQKRIRSVKGKDIGDFIIWSWENASKLVEREDLFLFYKHLAYADYIHQLGRRNRAWRVSYSSSRDLAYAMANWGKEEDNIWTLRKTKLNFPTSFKSYSRRKKFTSPNGRLRPVINKFKQRQHISAKKARKEINMLTYIGKETPKELGGIFARLNLELEGVKQFTEEYNLDKDEIIGGYEETRKKLGPKQRKEKRKRKTFKRTLKKKQKEKKEEKRKAEKTEEKEKEEKKEKKLDDFL